MAKKKPAEEGGREIIQDVGALLPAIPGGWRGCLVEGVAGYLSISMASSEAWQTFDPGQEAQRRYSEAYVRLINAVAAEAEKLEEEGIPPFRNAEKSS